MKKTVLFLFVFSTLFAVAQNRGTVETRALIQNFNNAKSGGKISKALLDRYPIQQGKNGPTIGVLAKVNSAFDAEQLEKTGIKVSSRIAQIVTMHVPVESLALLDSFNGIESYSVSHRVAPMMDNCRVDTRTDSVQAGLGVPMPFNGEGVLIGITDWGFDYTHPNINRKNNPRIVGAWDHYKLSGPAPEGFDYGTEYRDPDEIFEAHGDTSGLYGYGTHGTHVAGICGGLGLNGECIGQAPGAKYLLGSWYLDEAHWLDQVSWMRRVAQEEGKRLVINSSWGMYTFSTLDGSSILSQAINAYADSGVAFVTSGGNNGDVRYHIQRTFNGDDTLRSIAAWYGNGVGQALILWGEPQPAGSNSNGFQAGIAYVSNSDNSKIFYSPMFSTENPVDFLENYIVCDTDTMRYDVMVETANPLDQRPHILINADKNFNYKLMLICTANQGVTLNAWNMANIENHAGNMGCEFQNGGIYGCVVGDYYYGIGEPGCAEKTLTIAAHNSDRYVRDTTYICGAIASFSSYGPTLDGRVKPEISAPGVSVLSSISYWTTDSYTAVLSDMAYGRRYKWARMSGTSMSSPAVTGIVALMLQANPNLSVDDIRNILISTSRNDDVTGPLHEMDSASVRWGWGKADALRAVNAAYDKLSIEEAATIVPQLVAFPNPSSGMVTLLTGSNMPEKAEVYSIDGKCLLQTVVSGEATLDLSDLPNGLYFVRVHDRATVRTAKIALTH